MSVRKLRKLLEQLYPKMVHIRRELHMHPELSFQEVHTPQKIADFHRQLGLEVRTGVGGRGVTALMRGSKPGKTVALRADFDALPIQDEKEVEYKSQVPGVMHACGHDAHTATLLVLAEALSRIRDSIQGNIVFIHQFAEEVAPGGAKLMIEDGCLEGVDAIFGTHLWTPIPYGKIGYRTGPIMASSDGFEITVIGKGGHGARPHETTDSIVIGSHLVSHLQTIVSRRIDPLEPVVVTIGEFHAGNAYNVIADKAVLRGTVRTFDEKLRQRIESLMEEIVSSTCKAFGADCRFSYDRGYPPVCNHPEETGLLRSLSLEDAELFEMLPVMSGEDFAYYLQHVPGTFFFTGAGNPEVHADYPHHHPRFDIDERAMLIAAEALGKAALAYLDKTGRGDL